MIINVVKDCCVVVVDVVDVDTHSNGMLTVSYGVCMYSAGVVDAIKWSSAITRSTRHVCETGSRTRYKNDRSLPARPTGVSITHKYIFV